MKLKCKRGEFLVFKGEGYEVTLKPAEQIDKKYVIKIKGLNDFRYFKASKAMKVESDQIPIRYTTKLRRQAFQWNKCQWVGEKIPSELYGSLFYMDISGLDDKKLITAKSIEEELCVDIPADYSPPAILKEPEATRLADIDD